MVLSKIRKRTFYLVDVESRIDPAINLVNDVRGEADNVIFDFVGDYLGRILEDC